MWARERKNPWLLATVCSQEIDGQWINIENQRLSHRSLGLEQTCVQRKWIPAGRKSINSPLGINPLSQSSVEPSMIEEFNKRLIIKELFVCLEHRFIFPFLAFLVPGCNRQAQEINSLADKKSWATEKEREPRTWAQLLRNSLTCSPFLKSLGNTLEFISADQSLWHPRFQSVSWFP